ncbi:hypothetical protein [Epilithonimonas lactis]|uniref:Uncharacterized protein n=1 Tax=Epilithonimonas lactis TaxID=421072 RepID=A0A085B669_9FLAO|nr:hypothetical protein [Epilithonimonas lactis]KFC17964.1 hypothetical protein IO89_19385 [Epilithonimonas lactis]SEP90423.1 hypothetical protein SAMN04488097_1041 [Epilithonimonas lactis]
MKRLITIAAIAVVSLSFASCRQDDEATVLSNNETQEMLSNRKVLGDSVIVSANVVKKDAAVDPDPPYKDPTRW